MAEHHVAVDSDQLFYLLLSVVERKYQFYIWSAKYFTARLENPVIDQFSGGTCFIFFLSRVEALT